MASNIAEGLVARGWNVTLFATRNSMTRARLHAVVEKGYEEDPGADAKVAEYLHIAEAFEHADEFDLIDSHYDFMALSYSRLVRTPVLTTIHGFSSSKIMPVYEKYRDGYHVFASARALLHLNTIPERFGLVMAEANAAGVPVIAMDLGSCREVVENGRTGFLVSTPEQAVQALTRLAEIDRRTCRHRVEARSLALR